MFDCNLEHTHGLQKWSLWICAAKKQTIWFSIWCKREPSFAEPLESVAFFESFVLQIGDGFLHNSTLVAGFRSKKTSSGNRFVSVEDVAWMPTGLVLMWRLPERKRLNETYHGTEGSGSSSQEWSFCCFHLNQRWLSDYTWSHVYIIS